MNGMLRASARLMLIGGAGEGYDALLQHCQHADLVMVADVSAACAYLQVHRSAPPKLLIMEIATVDPGAAIEAIAAIKADSAGRLLPLVVICSYANENLLEACYRAGANAGFYKPGSNSAWFESAAALTGFWLGANELPPATDLIA
jgi:DNA-binding NarL/FixJ family response regulator